MGQRQPADRHDIFLSHSGAQKGFAKDLYRVLTSHGVSTFFDITHHSLPLAEPFPDHIFKAASSCKLAVVVLSNEYFSSKWPMSELCAFVRATPLVKVLPLFLHLLPEDLKKDQNLERWRKHWNSFAELQPQRINIKEWEEALRGLRSQNGLVHNPSSEGQLAFIERIVSSILSSPDLTPRNSYDTDYVQGEARLREIVLDKFDEMVSSSRSADGIACILGIHGISGSGKSTLCRSFENYFFCVYSGKTLQVEMPTDPTPQTLLHALKGLLRLTTLHIETDQMTHIDQVFCRSALLHYGVLEVLANMDFHVHMYMVLAWCDAWFSFGIFGFINGCSFGLCFHFVLMLGHWVAASVLLVFIRGFRCVFLAKEDVLKEREFGVYTASWKLYAAVMEWLLSWPMGSFC